MHITHAYPNKVYFELTNACNFNCDFCPISVSTRDKRTMPFSLFTKGIDQLASDRICGTVGFHVLGEPLLHPRLFEAIRYAGSRGLTTELTTNGALLTDGRVRALLQSGLDKLSVSLETMDGDEHESRRSTLSFDDYFRVVMNAVSAIRAADSKLSIELSLMNPYSRRFFDIGRDLRITGGISAYRKKLARLMRELMPDEPSVSSIAARLSVQRPLVLKVDGRTSIYVQLLGDWGNAFASRRTAPARIGCCGYAMKNIGVLSNGEVTICCVDYDGKTSLGNLNNASFRAILDSDQAVAIRKGFSRMRPIHPHCQRCIGGVGPVKTILKSLASIYLFRVMRFTPDFERTVWLRRPATPRRRFVGENA